MLSIVLLLRSARRFTREELLLILAMAPSEKVLFISIGKLIYVLSETHAKAF